MLCVPSLRGRTPEIGGPGDIVKKKPFKPLPFASRRSAHPVPGCAPRLHPRHGPVRGAPLLLASRKASRDESPKPLGELVTPHFDFDFSNQNLQLSFWIFSQDRLIPDIFLETGISRNPGKNL